MSGSAPPISRSEPGTDPVPPSRGRFRLLGPVTIGGFVAGVLLACALAVFAWWLPQRAGGQDETVAPPVEWQRTSVSESELPARSGVRLVRVAVTGGGGLLDLRFQVVDPNRAAAVHEPETPPAIVDERTGLVFSRLLMNHEHSGEFKPALTYYLIFENTGNWVRRGTEVTVLLGAAQVEHVVVQ